MVWNNCANIYKGHVLHCYLILVISLCSCRTEAVKVSFYEHYDKEGLAIKVNDLTGCASLPNRWQERISSVDSHGGCVVLFEHPHCTGRFVRLRPETATYVPNLKRIQFNDVIASLKPCHVTTSLIPGRYAIQNVDDKKYLTARNLVLKGFTAVETEKWREKMSQQWDVTQNRDGTFWLIPRIHFNKNPLTYDMRKYTKDDFPETGMFKEREYWALKNVKGNIFMIKNDDTRKCLLTEDERVIEQDDCDKDSRSQHWTFHRLKT